MLASFAASIRLRFFGASIGAPSKTTVKVSLGGGGGGVAGGAPAGALLSGVLMRMDAREASRRQERVGRSLPARRGIGSGRCDGGTPRGTCRRRQEPARAPPPRRRRSSSPWPSHCRAFLLRRRPP